MSSQKVVITGSRGIAEGVARALDSDQVFLIGGVEEDSKKLFDELPQVRGYSAIDLRDETAIEAAFAEANRTLNGITDVVGIVGGSGRSFGDGAIDTVSKAAWDATLELNLTTAFLTAREGIRYIKSKGSVTLTSSVLAVSPSPEYFKTHAYAVAKAGINGLVTALSAAYLEKEIRINAVAPSLVATPMAARAATNPQIIEFTKKKMPLVKEQLPVSDVVQAYIYLLKNRSVTGQIITIDGGWTVVSNV